LPKAQSATLYRTLTHAGASGISNVENAILRSGKPVQLAFWVVDHPGILPSG